MSIAMKLQNTSKMKIILLIFTAALTIRLLVGIFFHNSEVWQNFGDDNGRVAFAKSIIENGFVVETENFYRSESIFAPVIPILLALKIAIFGDNWLPIFILNLLISLPISFNGIGVREAGYVGLLSILSIPESTALLFALTEFGITLFGALIGASLFCGKKMKYLFTYKG